MAGVSRWLGYADSQFSFWDYAQCVHAAHCFSWMSVGAKLMEKLNHAQHRLEFMTQRFVSNLALQHRNGDFLLFKRVSNPWQWDKNKRFSAYLNEFYLIGPYEGEPFAPRSSNAFGSPGIEIGIELCEEFAEMSQTMLPFSIQQFRILRILAHNPNFKEEEVGKKLKISGQTVHTLSKYLLPKARDFFARPFANTKELASFLRKEALV